MEGRGTLTAGHVPCFLSGEGTLTVNTNHVSMSGTGTLTVLDTVPSTGSAYLQAFSSNGGNADATFASQYLPSFYSEANNDYVPPPPQRGYVWMEPLSSFGITETAPGSGSAMLPAFYSISGNCDYAYSSQSLPALWSFGIYGYNDQLNGFSRMTLASIGSFTRNQFISSIPEMTLETIGTFTKIQTLNIIGDGSTITDYSAFIAEHRLELLGEIALSGIILLQKGTAPVFDESSRTWSVNIDTNASSQYDNYGFTKLFNHDGISYGIADDGLYELTGDTDAGNDIDALIDFGRSDLGSPQKKRVENVYQGVGSSGKMLLKVDADEQVYTYEARSSSTAIKNHRVDVGKGLSGNYWNFTSINQNGDDFDFETLSFEPVELSRKI